MLIFKNGCDFEDLIEWLCSMGYKDRIFDSEDEIRDDELEVVLKELSIVSCTDDYSYYEKPERKYYTEAYLKLMSRSEDME